MTEEMKQKRDELAKLYGTNRFPVQNVEFRKDFTQDINFPRRMSHIESFQEGFDAAYQLMEAENAELKKKLLSVQDFSDELRNKYKVSLALTVSLDKKKKALKSRIEKLIKLIWKVKCTGPNQTEVLKNLYRQAEEFEMKADEGEG